MANPMGHASHHSKHPRPGAGVVYRDKPFSTTGEQTARPRRLNRPDWYAGWPRLARTIEDSSQLYQRYPWGFFVLGIVAGGLIGCWGRRVS